MLACLALLLAAGNVFAIHPKNEAALSAPDPAVPFPGIGAVIDNGLIKLGVNEEGHLNIAGVGSPSIYAGTTAVGLRLIYPTGGESESTAPGCLCEGWGASADGVSGYANVSVDGEVNLSLVSFADTATTAVSVVDIGGVLEVTHDYHPSAATPNLYEVTVTLTNTSGAGIADLRYRRVMDWDIGPTTFNEYVTIDSGTAADLVFTSDDGFETANPLGPQGSILFTGDAVDSGPTDHGALFDFQFGALAAGESKTFNVYYGATFNEPDALAALAAVGAEAYSFGQPNVDPPADHGEPNTFIFAFSGVGGEPIFGLDKELTSGPDRDGSVWYDDFSDTSGLTLNGSTAPSGSALRLVPALTGQRGSAFTTNPLTLGPGASFSTEFSFEISSSGAGGADGLTFTVHNDPAGDTALGGGGGAIGYTGITNSLTVEFDSWFNGAGAGDPNANHVGTATNGVLGSGIAVPLPPPNLDSGTVFYAWIDYDGLADSLEVRISTSSTRPAAPTLSQGGIGLAGLLGGTSAHVGFTSATGAAFGNHDILSWHFASAIDVVVPINVEIPTAYDFTITWNGDTPVWIYDRVPAEWDVTHIEFDDTGLPLGCGEDTDFVGPYGMVEISRGGKSGKKCNSDTGFRWMPGDDNTLNVQTLARCHNNRNNNFCRPTSCGALYLNYGAIALEKDPDTGELVLDDEGNPIVVDGPTDDICLAAVDDVNGDGTFTWDGTGDEDGDTLTDLEEACEIGTDPCLADTDGDGVRDDVDECPLEGPADPDAGEVLGPDGCIRQIVAGTFPVRGTFGFDLDLGAENPTLGAGTLDPPSDIWFARLTPTESEFVPLNGATHALWGATQPSISDCAGAVLAGASVNFFAMDPIAPSTWLCASTDEGRLSSYRVFSGDASPISDAQNIVVEFVTWH
jgi:hypothetical protein